MKIIPAKNSTASQAIVDIPPPSDSGGMDEYNRLKFKLLMLTLTSGLVIGLIVLCVYGWNIALSYFVGAVVGAIYIRMTNTPKRA